MTKKPFKNSKLIQKDTYKDTQQVRPSLNASHLMHIYQREGFFSRCAFGRISEKMFLKYLKVRPPPHRREKRRIGFASVLTCVIKGVEEQVSRELGS